MKTQNYNLHSYFYVRHSILNIFTFPANITWLSILPIYNATRRKHGAVPVRRARKRRWLCTIRGATINACAGATPGSFIPLYVIYQLPGVHYGLRQRLKGEVSFDAALLCMVSLIFLPQENLFYSRVS